MELDIKTLLDLPPDKKRLIAETLWDSIDSDEDGDLSQEEKDLLQQRWSNLQSGKSTLHDWDEVKRKILSSLT